MWVHVYLSAAVSSPCQDAQQVDMLIHIAIGLDMLLNAWGMEDPEGVA